MTSILLLAFLQGPILTLFQEGRAHVLEERTLKLLKGEQDVVLQDLPRGIRSETVELLSKAPGFKLVSSEVLFDLAPGKLLERNLGQEVFLEEEDHSKVSYRLRGYDHEYLYLEGKEGELRLLKAGDLARLHLPKVEGLLVHPNLKLRVRNEEASEVKALLSYITEGLSWRSEYTGILSGKTLLLRGWALLVNQTDRAWKEARVALFAGKPYEPGREVVRGYAALAQASEAEVTRYGEDFYRYDLKGLFDLSPKGEEKVLFLNQSFGTIERRYIFESTSWRAGQIILEAVLSYPDTGSPLPSGHIYLYIEEDGIPQYVSEDRLPLLAPGGETTLHFGAAQDLSARRKVKETKPGLAQEEWKETIEVEVKSGKDEEVTVLVVEHPSGRFWKVLESNYPPEETSDAGTLRFRVPVRAKSKNVLRYTIQYRR